MYFTPDFYLFFNELAVHNNKAWMDENRKRYHKNVKEPFEKFILKLQEEISQFDEEILIKPGKSIFRINRDIRFSKDKTPYKLNRSAIISKHGRKDKQYPGYYISLSPSSSMIGGGAYFLSVEALYKVRQEIAYNLDEFDTIINAPSFKVTFGKILGEKSKRIPKEFKEDAEKQELISNKSFYYMKEINPGSIFDKDFVSNIIKSYKTAKPFNDFLRRAIYH